MTLSKSLDDTLRGRLVVSCQAYPGEPMRDPRTMAQVAESVVRGGACAVRIQGIADIRATRAVVDVPIIGLWKVGTGGVFITPTLDHALAVARAGADIIAVDGTRRPRPDGLDLADTIGAIKECSGTPVMADCGSLADAVAAVAAGADLVSTALAGYTGERPATPGPDLDLVAAIASATDVPVVVEGRIRTPFEAAEALRRGAMAVCVGTAITHPLSITRSFCEALALPGEESA